MGSSDRVSKMSPTTRNSIVTVTVLLIILASGCNMPSERSAITPSMGVTQAYQTIQARLTEEAPILTEPAGEISPSPTTDVQITATDTPPAATTPAAATTAAPPANAAQACDQAAAGNPIDISIPDNTQIAAGEKFTKIWRLLNTGSCTWTTSYSATFFSGEQMGAAGSIPLPGEVPPGRTVDISVDLVAPSESGTHQGNWKLKNADNVLFGIGPNGSAPFWVRIVVQVTPTATSTEPTPTATVATATPTTTPSLAATQTPTSSPTATQAAVQAEGTFKLIPSNSIDLDQLLINAPNGSDLFYDTNADGQHLLVPQSGSAMGVYGNQQPSLNACQAASLAASPIIIETIQVGTYLCYQTDAGLPGRARLLSFDIDTYAIDLEARTWSTP